MGIRAMLSRLSSLLNHVDPELWYHLTHKNKVRITHNSFEVFGSLSLYDVPYETFWCLRAGQPTILCLQMDHTPLDTGML